MRPEAIKEAQTTRKAVMESVARRAHDTHIANKRNPKAVKAALSGFGPDVLGEDEDALEAAIKAKGG